MGPYRKNSGSIGGIELYQCPNIESTIYPVYTNKTVSGNFRGPEFPQGFFGIQSMMDDVAYKLKMDPVEFVLKNMTRKSNDEVAYTNYTLDECIRRGAEAFDWKKRWRPQARLGCRPDQARRRHVVHGVPLRRSAAAARSFSSMRNGQYTVLVGVTDVGAGAKTTMGMIAAEALGVPLSQVDVVWGDTDRVPVFGGRIRQPHDDHDRLRRDRGRARSEAADRRKGNAERERRADRVRHAESDRAKAARCARSFGAHFVEVEVDTELGHVRVLKYLAVHDCGRIMNPLTATSQIKGGATRASAWRCTKICSTTGAAASR